MIGIIIFSFLIFLSFYNFYWKRRNLPPGPTPWPILGNLYALVKYTPGYEAFLKWKREFGPIYTYWLSEMPVVAIADFETIQEMFVKNGDLVTGRVNMEKLWNFFRGGEYGIAETEGEFWREQRKFVLHVFRNFGLGRNLMEEKVLNEVSEMLASLQATPALSDVNLASNIELCIGSIINSLLFGYRYTENKESEFHLLKTVLTDLMKMALRPGLFIMIHNPEFFKNVPYLSQFYHQIVYIKKTFFGYFYMHIEEHEKDLINNNEGEAKDFVDAYLMEMKKDKSGNFSKLQLANLCLDLWIAGVDTSANTTCFAILYILRHPDVQTRMHQELDSLIGSNRLVTMSDKPTLTYISAVINESQRLANLLPQNVLHRATSDLCINGYHIPKNTTIVPQISCVLYDEKIFPEPYKFIPERFLTSDGCLKKVDELIPFSVGKRICLGEGLAKMELFLIIANLYNQYKVLPTDPSNLPTLEKQRGVTVQPYPFKVKLEKRF